MVDMSTTVAPKSDQLSADDLIAGPRTIRITRVAGNAENAEQPVNVFFEGDDGKPYRPCKSMRRVMIAAWGKHGGDYVGRRMTLYCDPKVKFGGMEVGGIRISHMSHIKSKMALALTVTKARRAPFIVMPLPDEPDQPDTAATLDAAKAEAAKGTDAFRAYWKTLDAATRGNLKPHMADLQKIAADADAPAPEDDDPFGLPTHPNDKPTILDQIREHLSNGADAASIRTFLADEIERAIAADPGMEVKIEAALADPVSE